MSILIINNDKENTNKWISNYIKNIENRRINIFNNIDIITSHEWKVSLSTKDIRELIQRINKKPQNLKTKYLIIYNFDRATPQAQNAFLKTLEESKANIILQAKTKVTILDTIISRVKTIYIKQNKKNINEKLYKIIEDIVYKKELSKIKNLLKLPEEDVIETLEYFLLKNKNIKSTKLFYEYKKRVKKVPLNKEVQYTAILMPYFI